jgi:predicted porin
MHARIFAVGVVAATTIGITPAHAQSSVTVFGILDVTVRHVKND